MMSRGKILRSTFAFALLSTGAVFVLLNVEGSGGVLISKVGLALIVTGVVSLFRELAILPLESEERGDAIATKVRKQILGLLPGAGSIRMIAHVRRGYDGYYTWALKTSPQDLFFAGRSVLHRIDYDFKRRGLGSAEGVLARRLAEGASIRIMFINPRSNIIERLAEEEGQSSARLLSDIATSIGICKRLYLLLTNRSQPNSHAQLFIRVYDEIPYFAYHKEDDKVIVGFYFATTLGLESSAFEVMDDYTRNRFEGHFTSIFNRTSDKTLMSLSVHSGKPDFNENLYKDLYSALVDKLGEQKTEQLIQCLD